MMIHIVWYNCIAIQWEMIMMIRGHPKKSFANESSFSDDNYDGADHVDPTDGLAMTMTIIEWIIMTMVTLIDAWIMLTMIEWILMTMITMIESKIMSSMILLMIFDWTVCQVPYEDLRYLFGEIMYGGHITDDWDRRLCKFYLEEYVDPELLEGELYFAKDFLAPPNSDYLWVFY